MPHFSLPSHPVPSRRSNLVEVHVLHAHVLHHGRLLIDVGRDHPERRAALFEHPWEEGEGGEGGGGRGGRGRAGERKTGGRSIINYPRGPIISVH